MLSECQQRTRTKKSQIRPTKSKSLSRPSVPDSPREFSPFGDSKPFDSALCRHSPIRECPKTPRTAKNPSPRPHHANATSEKPFPSRIKPIAKSRPGEYDWNVGVLSQGAESQPRGVNSVPKRICNSCKIKFHTGEAAAIIGEVRAQKMFFLCDKCVKAQKLKEST